MRSSWKRWLHILGGGLGLLGVIFVALRLHTYSGELDFARFDTGDWLLIGFLSLVYGAGNLLLAKAWQQLLLYFDIDIDGWRAARIYGLSQLAKYVPGNIFHLAGRQALGMAAGLPVGGLVKSALWELGLITVAGALFVFLIIPLVWSAMPMPAAVVLFVAVLIVALFVLHRLLSFSMSKALLWQGAFLFVSSAVFIVLLNLVSSSDIPAFMLPALCGAYVIAWLAGFVTPGAPAGVGVRELVLLFLLKAVVVEADLLLAIVLGRVVTVWGDVCFFGAAIFFKKMERSRMEIE